MLRVFALIAALLTASLVVGAVLLLRRFLSATEPVHSTPAESVQAATVSASGPRRRVSGLLSAAASEEQSEPRAPDDFEKTMSWVEERLRECGFNSWQAVSLAEAGVDWHQAKLLIDLGCSHETALDILLP